MRFGGVAVVVMVLCAEEPLYPPILNGVVFSAGLLLLIAVIWPSKFAPAALRKGFRRR